MGQQRVRLFKKRSILATLLVCLLGTSMAAEAEAAEGLPPLLTPWRDWVSYQQEFRQCPLMAGTKGDSEENFLCLWPGELKLEIEEGGARFSQHWKLEAPSWLPLPGDSRDWPQEVRVNGLLHPTLLHEGAPALWLLAGDYKVQGHIPWQERPQSLSIPAMSGLVALSIDGKPVQPLQRKGNRLTLGRSTAAAEAADSAEFQLYRKLTDSIPAQLTTHIQLRVSGKARELRIAPVLPEHFIATSLETPWPARLDAEGGLLIQVQPGQATLILNARAVLPLTRIQARLPQTLLQEVWSYEAVPTLRVAAITPEGEVVGLDAKQAGVPAAWQSFPAFAMSDLSTLNVEERSRGTAADESNRLTLTRKLWLDFSGEGYFAKDSIYGQMRRGWRFDLAPPYRLQRASTEGEGLLITEGGEGGWTGVEWRSQQAALEASLRIAAGPFTVLPVTGWQQAFDRVDMTLHLPYGYQLLAAPGADSADNSWVARWRIFDVFFAAFVALLAWRLLGGLGGALTAAYVLLAMHEPGAPLWALGVVLVLGLLHRALPEGWFRKALRFAQYTALAVFLLKAALFIPGELRSALHPQLEHSTGDDAFNMAGLDRLRGVSEEALLAGANLASPTETKAEAMLASPSPMPSKNKMQQRYAQSNVVQAGVGEPDWTVGQRYNLSWTGPILAEQTMRLIISPPWLTRLLRVVMAMLLGLLFWRITRSVLTKSVKPTTATPSTSATLLALGVWVGYMQPAPAHAQFPSEELLKVLKERVNQPPRCVPDCASIARAEIEARGNTLRIQLEAHAGDRIALPLPTLEENAMLLKVRIDGRVVDAVRAGFLPLSRGIHLVELEYGVQADTSVQFALRPKHVVFSGQGWRAAGIDEDRLLNETLHLSRLASEVTAGATEEKEVVGQAFPSYVRVTRVLRFELDWTVETVVRRLSPREGGLTLAVPLLLGEHITTPGIKTQGGEALLSLGHTEGEVRWNSRLEKREALELVAPELAERAEVWQMEISPSWHPHWEGVPVVLHEREGEVLFEFHPLPGEKLAVRLGTPPVVEGKAYAIDSANLEHAIGMRAIQHTLSFRLRASQGGEHSISLPSSEMEVLSVKRNDETLNLRPRKGKLTLPVSPGAQTFSVSLREPREVSTVLRMPEFNLHLPVANMDVGATLPKQRWLLASSGPTVGPAVLYWGELLVALVLAALLAFFLARRGWTSLRFHQWFLLVLGFSTFSWVALALVISWLVALEWRQRAGALSDWKTYSFYGVQLGLLLLTVVALVCFVFVIPKSLLGMPDMGIAGHGSYGNRLMWFADKGEGPLPAVTLFSLPMWAYRTAMLVWALWLAQAVIGWLRRGLAAWMQGKRERKTQLKS